MKVERIDLYDFKITLTEQEFGWLKIIATKYNRLIEQSFANLLETWLFKSYQIQKGKES